jgi:cytidine deaminase
MTAHENRGLEVDEDDPIGIALDMLNFAQANISKHKVGACLLARNAEGKLKYFGGCNIEYSVGSKDNIHAEVNALNRAITEGYRTPLACWVTSTNTTQRAAMCGFCMQAYCYVNEKCQIIVVNLDRSIKFEVSVEQRNGEWGYHSKGQIDP